MTQQPIALYLVSGFLGAGKTTFLRRLLERLADRKTGLLVNEFGSVGIDGALLPRNGIQMAELNNGSIFCACLKDSFVKTLKAFSDTPIDLLLIEASGMADPASMPAVLERLAPYLPRPYDYRGAVCLVDCTTVLDYLDMLLPLQNQVATADLIVLNKTDLVSEEQVQEIQQSVRTFNPEAAVYRTTYSDVPAELLEGLVNHGRSGDSSNTPWNRPAVYTLETPPLQGGQEAVRQFCQAIAPLTLRIKGTLVTEEGTLFVDGVCSQLELAPAPEHMPQGTLVLIGKGSDYFDQELETAWEQAFHVPCPLM